MLKLYKSTFTRNSHDMLSCTSFCLVQVYGTELNTAVFHITLYKNLQRNLIYTYIHKWIYNVQHSQAKLESEARNKQYKQLVQFLSMCQGHNSWDQGHNSRLWHSPVAVRCMFSVIRCKYFNLFVSLLYSWKVLLTSFHYVLFAFE